MDLPDGIYLQTMSILEINNRLEKNDVNLVKQYGPIKFTDYYEGDYYDWKIYVFVFIIKKNSKINIDWEHIEKKWILPSEIGEYNTVPFLKEIVYKILL